MAHAYNASIINEIHEFNAQQLPERVNVGGGPNFLHKGWRNLDNVYSLMNPVPTTLAPDVPFPIATASLQTVYSSHTLEHLDDETVDNIIGEAFRTLKPGGKLIVKIPDFDEYLQQWRNNDSRITYSESFCSFKEVRTWKNRRVPDNITYRTATMFCSLWDEKFGGDSKSLFSKQYDLDGEGYVGAPWIPESEIQNILNSTRSCHEISKKLREQALTLGERLFWSHQNAWSRTELSELIQSFGFQMISTDRQEVIQVASYIPTIELWEIGSAYYLAEKPT